MFKGIKKKLTANRSNARSRRLGNGTDLGDTPPREPPDRGGSKPISPRQIHPSDQVPPVPYSRRSIERSRTAPMKSGHDNIVTRLDKQPFYGAQRHTLQGPAYPISPNICVTGGKIEFVTSVCSPVFSEESDMISPTIIPLPTRSPQEYSSPKHQLYYSSPRNYRKKQEGKNYLTNPKLTKQNTNINSRPPFSIYSSSEFKSTSPTSSTTSRNSRRRERLERKRNNAHDPKSNSLMQHSLPPRSPDIENKRSATMPVREEIHEVEFLRQENSDVKCQLAQMQKELSKIQNKVKSLQREKNERTLVDEETSKEQLSQYQNIVDRCNALEEANAQLQQESQCQRQEYEKCLDNVALQVVQAIIVQKKQQEECDRLSKKVQILQKQNTNLSSLLSNKAKSMSPSYAQQVAGYYEVFSQCSQSLPNTLLRKEKKRNVKNSCSNESELSQTSDENSRSKSELTDQGEKSNTECWYDVIKAIGNGNSKDDNGKPGLSTEPLPSSQVQTGFVPGSSHSSVLATHPNSSYAKSSSNQQLIVNSLTCITSSSSYLSSLTPKTSLTKPSTSVVATKLPHINQVEKNTVEGIKDEGYSTMSSDVQTEPKVSVSTIATVEEEKGRPVESDQETEKVNSPTDSSTHTNYMNGLRIMNDVEDDRSNVFLIGLHDNKDGNTELVPLRPARIYSYRSLSESDLTKTTVITKSFIRRAKDIDLNSLPYFSVTKKNLINLQLKSLVDEETSKTCRNGYRKNEASSLERDHRCAEYHPLHKTNSNSPSTYSHAEMEDWSLELSAEDLSTPSASIVSGSNLLGERRSVREGSNFELEDQPEMSWNGTNYSEHLLDWQYDKSVQKPWHLLNNNSRSLLSPKSGCSDQPAAWSSIEHLSSCSDVASKCSTDIENFCDQLCKLPELKRLSSSSIDNLPDANSLLKFGEVGSMEDNSELNENVVLDNVFTRDFYRLIRFESTKSLAEASCLTPSETSTQTLDRRRDSSINKTFTSVLGFIAEQQKYCKQRELLDKSNNFGVANTLDSKGCLNNNAEISNTNFVTSNNNINKNNTAPGRPKRSTSLNLNNGYIASKGTLPSLPTEPLPPSRSSSRVTLPRHSIHSQHPSDAEDLPPPPDSICAPLHTTKSVPNDPPVPPHRVLLPTPKLPERSSSKQYKDSPPVPKRITSRALPTVPLSHSAVANQKPSAYQSPVTKVDMNIPPRTTSLASDKFKRSNSLQTSVSKKVKLRNSCGDVMPNCRSSRTLLIHLKQMAQEEDESNKEQTSPEPSPTEEVGLGTGWVRVQPISGFTDNNNCHTLLSSGMPSSEVASSETDEDCTTNRPHEHLIKSAQRNRRRKKVSRHREEPSARPIYDHVRNKERNDLDSVYLMESVSSSSEDQSNSQCSSVSKFCKNLDSLPSSEFCDTSVDFLDRNSQSRAVGSFGFLAEPIAASSIGLSSTAKMFSGSPIPMNRSPVCLNPVLSNVALTDARNLTAAKRLNFTPRPSSFTSRPQARPSTVSCRPSSMNFSEPVKRAQDPLNSTHKYMKQNAQTTTLSKVPNNKPSELVDQTPIEDLSKTQVLSRKNSLVYRIKENFEKPQQKIIKPGYEKDRLKSPNVRAVIEKFSLPSPTRNNYNKNIEISKLRNEQLTKSSSNRSNNAIKSHRPINFPTKTSSTMNRNFQNRQACGTPAKIPIPLKIRSTDGRISISDSCGEIFSPLSSEEDVFGSG